MPEKHAMILVVASYCYLLNISGSFICWDDNEVTFSRPIGRIKWQSWARICCDNKKVSLKMAKFGNRDVYYCLVRF